MRREGKRRVESGVKNDDETKNVVAYILRFLVLASMGRGKVRFAVTGCN